MADRFLSQNWEPTMELFALSTYDASGNQEHCHMSIMTTSLENQWNRCIMVEQDRKISQYVHSTLVFRHEFMLIRFLNGKAVHIRLQMWLSLETLENQASNQTGAMTTSRSPTK
jgi:hypothetical protein